MKIVFLLIAIQLVVSVKVEKKPFVRQLPADSLRDFPGKCFASTIGKVVEVNESWKLGIFCGESTCKLIKNDKNEETLIEEVKDCGPVVDLANSPGCKLLNEKPDPTVQYPDCCPEYDCEDVTKIQYLNVTAPVKSK